MKYLFLFLIAGFVSSTHAQEGSLSGKVVDNVTKQAVVGAKIALNPSLRAISDFDGNYKFDKVPYGSYTLTVAMLSFDTMRIELTIDQPINTYDIILGGSQELDEVKVIGNIAQDRKTPVAVSTLGKKELDEELGSQDLPMILNSKPGVHATQQGGGDGDARITIRGFDQRNVGVMIDGVPVNDMENGWVYWSNWFGLDAITQQIQIQRGLGATKLAMPSVGGTMNIITDNTSGKREINVDQEYGTGNFLRTSFSYKSGTLKNGWGVLFSGSYKQGNGWVDGLNTQGGFYYLKIQKKFKNHVLSLSGFGAPQQHGQRSFNQPIEYWDSTYALNNGITASQLDAIRSKGTRFNQHWGWVTDTITGEKSVLNERRNFYHKPQITLKDFWKVNEKFSWSNMAYVSIGRGGGERYYNSSSTILYDEEGLVDWDQIIYNNRYKTLFGNTYSTVDYAYDSIKRKSSQVLAASVNNHFWVGGLSQFDYKVSSKWKVSGGLDYRYYKGQHYTVITDLLGGDYFVNDSDQNAPSAMKVVGDKIARADLPYQNNRDGFMQWMGAFGQAEYSHGRWTSFVNVSTVVNGYKGVDYFRKKELHDGDSIIYVGYDDTVTYNGKTYTTDSEELIYNQTDWKFLAGFTVKAGANFNLSERSNIFLNLGYLSRTPQFSNVIDNNTNSMFVEILNEVIYATEVGYGFRSKKLSINGNGYFTYWNNKPFPFGVNVPNPLDPTEFVRANINGMDALHMGLEVDVAWNIHKSLVLEAMASVGDWTWQSSETIDVLGTKFTFDAKGVHVGDAAQSTYAGSLRWSFIKNGYIKVKYTFFDRYYSSFDPFSLQGANGGRESWKIPSYGIMSIHAGYRVKFEKSALNFKGNVFNALNALYISDARNNGHQDGSENFDANSATVFFGQGTTFNVSVGFEF
ncbi:MAG: TonB-dependent receptor [Crocinitomicaceae bacterium]|jgi:iron complex outermembrane recepter protein|nr:TonB-dependent receptor [Crocinitomicaceae bacterium]